MISTRLYAADGSLFTEFSKEKRVFAPIESIPQNLINAFLAAEDANFYKHSGIDPVAIFRTSIRNFIGTVKGDRSMGGASTITQQVVKNLLLSKEKTLQRKVREAILSFRITQAFSKDKILELYLNQIYLGSGSYGVAAAAQTYFSKSVDELNIEECALLAALPKAPSSLDPRKIKNNELAKDRRNWVISRMYEEGFIKSDEARIATESPIKLKMKTDDGIAAKADAFADSVKKQLTELYGSDNVFESGIVVRTTLDVRLQKIATKTLQDGVEEYDHKHGYRGAIAKIDVTKDWADTLKNLDVKKLYKSSWQKAVILSVNATSAEIGLETGESGSIDLSGVKWAKKYNGVNSRGATPKKVSDVLKVGDAILVEKAEAVNFYNLKQAPEVNGAMIAMDPHSGRVLAMMGGYIDAPNQFNRSTQAMRQPGSTMKTFGYIAALENGLTPATIVIDEEISLDQGPGMAPYKPMNYSNEFYGPTTLRKGLEMSRNVTTVKMAEQVGLDKIADVAKRFGISDDPKALYSLVLGAEETTAIRLATAYSMMVNGGKRVTPSMIEKIQDREGKIIYRNDKRSCAGCSIAENAKSIFLPILDDTKEQVTDPATAFQITSMLQGVVDRGTAAKAKSVGKIIAGKTGTTNNSYDSWFAGFSPDLVVVVYIGFDTPKSLGSEETGASISLPIFTNFMKEALKDTPSTPFRVPGGIKFVKIDRTTGRLASPLTPKENTFFEVFKNDDAISEADENSEAETNNAEENIEPSGIY